MAKTIGAKVDNGLEERVEEFMDEHGWDSKSAAIKHLIEQGMATERQTAQASDTILFYVTVSFALFSIGLVLASLTVYPTLDRVALATSVMTMVVMTAYVTRLISLPGVALPGLREGGQ